MNASSLEAHLTPHRVAGMRAALARRLSWLVVVLDNLHDRHNISAVLRSCDAFGVQEVHVIESTTPFEVNPLVSQGVERWLTIRRWPGFAACCSHLRRRGFALYATALGSDACGVHELPLDRKIAVVFGNEHRGVDADLVARCDGNVLIPMHGFTQSLNVSVAAAVTIAVLSEKLRSAGREHVFLSSRARAKVYAAWLQAQTEKRWARAARAGAGTP